MPSYSLVLPNGVSMRVMVPPDVKKTIRLASLRGRHRKFAWNLSRFSSLDELLADEYVRHALGHAAVRSADQSVDGLGTKGPYVHEQIVYPGMVGWSSTVPMSNVSPEVLVRGTVPFLTEPQWLVRLDSVAPAPQTLMINVVYRLRVGDDGWTMFLFHLYPGEHQIKFKSTTPDLPDVALYDRFHPGA